MFSKNMRSFHNKVKSLLISHSAQITDGKTLLDIGCGRGGDLFKWHNSGLEYVYAYDPNDSYIEEAKKRMRESGLRRNYVFSTDLFRPTKYSHQFDVVSCQFAIHYLFASDEVLNEHLDFVQKMLKPGGVYVGTFMDGDSVIQRVAPLQDNYFENQAVRVQIPYMDNIHQDTGVPINVHLSSTLYFGEKSVSHEFVVKKEVLTRRCKEVGLRLVSYTPFQMYNSNMKYKMGDDFSECSYMYTSFAFQKIVPNST